MDAIPTSSSSVTDSLTVCPSTSFFGLSRTRCQPLCLAAQSFELFVFEVLICFKLRLTSDVGMDSVLKPSSSTVPAISATSSEAVFLVVGLLLILIFTVWLIQTYLQLSAVLSKGERRPNSCQPASMAVPLRNQEREPRAQRQDSPDPPPSYRELYGGVTVQLICNPRGWL